MHVLTCRIRMRMGNSFVLCCVAALINIVAVDMVAAECMILDSPVLQRTRHEQRLDSIRRTFESITPLPDTRLFDSTHHSQRDNAHPSITGDSIVIRSTDLWLSLNSVDGTIEQLFWPNTGIGRAVFGASGLVDCGAVTPPIVREWSNGTVTVIRTFSNCTAAKGIATVTDTFSPSSDTSAIDWSVSVASEGSTVWSTPIQFTLQLSEVDNDRDRFWTAGDGLCSGGYNCGDPLRSFPFLNNSWQFGGFPYLFPSNDSVMVHPIAFFGHTDDDRTAYSAALVLSPSDRLF